MSPNERGEFEKFQRWEILRHESENGKLAKFEIEAEKMRRGRDSQVTWEETTRTCNSEQTWCRNHPKLFVCCQQQGNICPWHCEGLEGCRSHAARRIEIGKAVAETATNALIESESDEERADGWERRVDELNHDDEGCMFAELEDKEDHHTLTDRLEAFDDASAESKWCVAGDTSEHSDDEN